MLVDDTGKTWTYTNNRGCKSGTLEPLWRPGSNVDGSDYTHGGMGQTVESDSIRFAKVFGEPEAFSLGGRADYIWIEDTGPSPIVDPGLHMYHIHVWQNEGRGATRLKGEIYCFYWAIRRLQSAVFFETDILYSQLMVTVTATCSVTLTAPWTMYGSIQAVI
jgi:hypothetical protein